MQKYVDKLKRKRDDDHNGKDEPVSKQHKVGVSLLLLHISIFLATILISYTETP